MIYVHYKNRPAFTMLELVFVIIILGILASYAMPRMNRDLRQEAADNILSDIRYTQHLALNDNKHDDTDTWQRRFWNIGFRQCSNAEDSGSWYQAIFSDRDKNGNIDIGEEAIDPSNGMSMNAPAGNCSRIANISPRIFLTKKYTITRIVKACDNNNDNNTYIGFDYLGRPHNGFLGAGELLDSYLNGDCTFTFSSPNFDTNLVIQINKETGYAFIIGQPNS